MLSDPEWSRTERAHVRCCSALGIMVGCLFVSICVCHFYKRSQARRRPRRPYDGPRPLVRHLHPGIPAECTVGPLGGASCLQQTIRQGEFPVCRSTFHFHVSDRGICCTPVRGLFVCHEQVEIHLHEAPHQAPPVPELSTPLKEYDGVMVEQPDGYDTSWPCFGC